MTTTLRDTPITLGDPTGDEPVWTLVVAHHPTPALVGLRRILLPGSAIDLGRDGDALGPGGLCDPRLSRLHARVEVTAGGALRIDDAGSSNGTWVNARAVADRELDVDDVVRVGSIVMVVARAPARMRPIAQGPVPALSWAMARVLDTLGALAPGRSVVCWGEPDAGVDEVARWLHARESPGAPWVHLPADAPDATVPPDATVLLGPVGDLEGAELAARVDALRRAARRVVLWAEVLPRDQEAAELPAHPALAAMDPAVLRVPPLRERAADLPLLLDLAARRHHGRGVALHPRLVTALLLAAWPGNLRQLDALVRDRMRPGDAPLRLDGDLAREIGAPRESAEDDRAGDAARYVIDHAGRWFVGPDGRRVTVHPRRALVNLLAALAARGDGGSVDTAALIAAGWPGERLVGSSGATRVYVALSTLRRLGLRAAITREGAGYRLGGPGARVEVS